MPDELKAGSWVGDISNEWRRAKTPEKVIIVLAVVATVGIALYLRKQSQGPNQPGAQGSGVGGVPANFQQGSGGGGGGTSGGGTPTPAPAPIPTPAPPAKPPTQGGGKPPAKPIPPAPAPAIPPAPAPARPPAKPVAPPRQPTTVTAVYAKHPVTYGGRPAGGPVAPGGVNPPVRPAAPPPDYTKQNAPYVHPTRGPF